MSGGLWSEREIVYGDSSASSVEGEPPLVLPASDSSEEGQEILLNNEVGIPSLFLQPRLTLWTLKRPSR
jgi:hypothetical protein